MTMTPKLQQGYAIFTFKKRGLKRLVNMAYSACVRCNYVAQQFRWDRVRAEWEALPDDEKAAYEKRSEDSGQEPHTRMEIDQSPNQSPDQSPNLRLGD